MRINNFHILINSSTTHSSPYNLCAKIVYETMKMNSVKVLSMRQNDNFYSQELEGTQLQHMSRNGKTGWDRGFRHRLI